MPQALTIKGLSGVQQAFLFLATETKREVKTATLDTLQQMVLDAREGAPEDTGRLKRGIHFEITNNGFSGGLLIDVDYWVFIEMGTGGLTNVPSGWEDLAAPYKGKGVRQINLPPRPFVIPAWQKNSNLYYRRVGDALDRIFR